MLLLLFTLRQLCQLILIINDNGHFLFYYCIWIKVLDRGYFNLFPSAAEIHLTLISVFTFPYPEE